MLYGIIMMPFWARRRLKSPASPLFAQLLGAVADQRKYQTSASLTFVRGIHRWPVNSPHKGLLMRKMFSFGDVIVVNDITPFSKGIKTKQGHKLIEGRGHFKCGWLFFLSQCTTYAGVEPRNYLQDKILSAVPRTATRITSAVIQIVIIVTAC